MPRTAPSIAACLVLQGETPPALDADIRRLAALADEVVVYDTADHVAPGSAAFEATLHPAVTVVSGFWAEDRARAKAAALAHVRADWALCVLPGEKLTGSTEQLRAVLAGAAELPALSVLVDDVVRGTHRSARLLHRGLEGAGCQDAGGEVPSGVLTIQQPVATTARVPRQRGVFEAV
ncbi:hypothetical protein [Kineococcus glutinatus]|uniref:Uncharacterized protein n=1 Tax=Kineococcus glutinatus TaxID=1070872 RepID=A0ABP9HAG5_9ACTN